MNPRYNYDAGELTLRPKLSRRQRSFLKLAQRVAESSDCVQRHGAVAVRSGSVLSVGHNKWRNEAALMNDLFDTGRSSNVSVHAEIDALSRIKNPQGITLYIARIGKSGEPRMSKPCDVCAQALKDAGVNKVIYTV